MSWARWRFGERATYVLAPNADIMTLDGTNTWVLREPGRAVSGDRPGAVRRVAPRRGRRLAGEVVRRPAHPRAPRPHRGGSVVRRADRLRRTRARPGAPAWLGGARRRRRRRVDGLEIRVVGDAGAHLGLAVLRAAGGRRSSPATRSSGAEPPSSRTPTASSAPISARCSGCTAWPRRRRSGRCGPGTGR